MAKNYSSVKTRVYPDESWREIQDVAPLRKVSSRILRYIFLSALLVLFAVLLTPYIHGTKHRVKAAMQHHAVISLSSRLPQLSNTSSAVIYHRVSRGDTFGHIVTQYGLSEKVGTNLHNAMLKLKKSNDVPTIVHPIQQGKEVELTLDENGLVRFVAHVAPGQEIVIRREGKNFNPRLHTAEIVEKERVALGAIETSFAGAAEKAGISYGTIDDLVDLLSARITFQRDFRVGDRFCIIYRERVLPDGTPSGETDILAAAIEVNGESNVAIRYVGDDGKARYFDEHGKLLGNSFLRYPLKFSRISSTFSYARFHPILKIKRPHNGVDFAAPQGTPVRSVADGRVLFAGPHGGSGNMVKIQHNERYATAYLHLSQIRQGLRQGVRVTRGEVIGAVGSTGLATGPHLHFSFYDNGVYTDPLKIQLPTLDDLTKGTRIDQGYLERVLFTLDHYQGLPLDKKIWGL